MTILVQIKKHYFLILILILAIILLSINLNKPFIGHHDWNGAFWGSQTRNYLNYLTSNSGEFNKQFKQIFFDHYTPLLPLIFTMSAFVFGLSEFSMRIVPLIFSIIMIIFIYKIGQEIYNNSVGLLAAALVTVTPIFIYFGKLPDHEPIVTSLITVTFYLYLISTKNNKAFFLYIFFLIISFLESWPAFFLVPSLALFSFFVRKEKINKVLLPIVVAFLVIGFHLTLTTLIKGPENFKQFISQGLFRIGQSNLQVGLQQFSLSDYFITEAHYAVIYYTRILLILAALWLIYFLLRLRKKLVTVKESSLIILLIYPLLFILTFKQLAYIHDYKLYHFLPFIGLSCANSAYLLSGKIKDILQKIGIKGKKYKIAGVVFCILIVSLVFIERMKFLNVLLKTSFNTPGYELGLLIKEKTSPQDAVLVNSNEFKAYFEVFVNYYSGRKVVYENIDLNNFKKEESNYKKFKYIISIEDRTIDPDIENFLSRSFLSQQQGPYTFFNMSQTLE